MDTTPTAAPAPTTEHPVVHGAPVPLTSLVGRAAEARAVVELLARHRLVTLTGPGGVGKTRLAGVVAPVVPSARSWWVSFAAPAVGPSGPEAVVGTVVDAVGVPPGPSATAADRLARHLSGPPTLLVLDTCDHLAAACAALVEDLLRRCPHLRVLATSRVALHVGGEVLWPVPPLAHPEPDQLLLPAHLEEYDAVRLFVERATAADPGFALDERTTPAVAAICRRLTGNPLALELAAARARLLGPVEIAAALDDGVDLLAGRSASAPARQQTLRATLDWSHALLEPGEATVLRRLSVFVGGAGLAAVLSVCGLLPDPAGTLELLSGLADKSLLLVGATVGGSKRFGLAEPVRRYAASHLEEAGEEDDVRARHLAWCRELAAAGAAAHGPQRVAAADAVEAELPNALAAFGWALDAGRVADALGLAADLAGYCAERGHHREGRELLARALSAAARAPRGRVDPAVLDRAREQAGVLAFLQCDYEQADSLLAVAAAGHARRGDDRGTARARQALAGVRREHGDLAGAAAELAACLRLWDRLGDPYGRARCRTRLAFTELLAGHHERAAGLARESLRDAGGDAATIASALVVLGHAELAAGRTEAAHDRFAEAVHRAHLARLPEETAYAEEGLGRAALAAEDADRAAGWLAAALQEQHALGDLWRTAAVLVVGAAADIARGDVSDAQRLLGASQSLLATISGRLGTDDEALAARLAAAGDGALGADLAGRLREHGSRLPLEEVVAAAFARLDRPRPLGSPQAGGGSGQVARTTSGPAPLHVCALGAGSVALDGRELSRADFAYAKPRELMFLLLGHPDGLTKGQIGTALWLDSSAAALRGAFHTTLRHLREAVGPQRVRYAAGRYAIEVADLRYDVADVLAELESARAAAARPDGEADELAHLTAALASYTGEYLPDFDADWAAQRRDELRLRLERAGLAQGRLLLRQGRPLAAAAAYARVVDSDPLLEAAHRGVMTALAAAGEPGRALRQYARLTATLRAELDAEPSAETAALARRIGGLPGR